MNPWTEGVSVIVPVRNGAPSLPRFFKALAPCEVLEVLVCDGGSNDDTVAIARNHGAHVFRGDEPMSAINTAVQNARGTSLWLLPSTARPPRLAAGYILDILSDPDFVGGYFRLQYWQKNRRRRWESWKANQAASLFGTILLEHGIFADRHAVQQLGGIPVDGPRTPAALFHALRKKGRVFVFDQTIKIDRHAPHTPADSTGKRA